MRRLHRLARQHVSVRQWRRCQAQELLQKRLHAKVSKRRAKEGRRELAAAHGIQVKLVARTVKKLDVVHQVLVILFANQAIHGWIAQLGLHLGNLLGSVCVAVTLKGNHAAGLTVKDTAEVATRTNRPVHRIRANAQHVLNLFHKLKGVARLAVELVYKGKDRNVAQRAYLEELDGLRLYALGGVNHHNGGVGSHQSAVSILRKVLVSRSIKDVDAAAVIGELQHRGGNGNATLLLDVHPVRNRVLGARLALNRTSCLNGAGIQQKLLGKGGLAGVWVRNNRERAA